MTPVLAPAADLANASANAPISCETLQRFDVPGPRYTSYPTADRFVEAFTDVQYREALARRAARLNGSAPPGAPAARPRPGRDREVAARLAQAEGSIAIDDDLTTPVFSPYSGRVVQLIAKLGDTVEPGASISEPP